MSETNRGGQPGNQNARVGSIVRGAIRRVFAENEAKGRESLVNIVRNLVDKAELEGDLPSAREIFDRLDGKSTQPIAGDSDMPGVKLEGVVKFDDPAG